MMDKARILVVDDDEDVRDMVQMELAKAGFRSDSAATAQEGLAMMEHHLYPVVVLDIHMPGTNGVEMLGSLKQLNSLVQVLMLTSDASMHRVIECMDRGAADFFSKTESMCHLVGGVAAALGRTVRWMSWMGTRANRPLTTSVGHAD
jgi:phosphoserine phosphatase RsbU/P